VVCVTGIMLILIVFKNDAHNMKDDDKNGNNILSEGSEGGK
jgi:hypothetical protein